MYYLPVYYETIKGFSSLESGLAVLPETLSLVPASILIGYLVSWTGSYRWATWLGWVISALGSALLYLLESITSKGVWISLNLPIGVGMGLLFGAMGFAVQAAVDVEIVPLAVTLYSFCRAFGAALGISIGTAIFTNAVGGQNLRSRSLEYNGAAFVKNSSYQRGLGEDSSPNKISTLANSEMTALRHVWIFCAVSCAVALVGSFGIESISLDQPLAKKNDHHHTPCDHPEAIERFMEGLESDLSMTN
ncbi:hypothetical protein N7478_007093 [Penicillium angulare]|uniref:uncharacterized protein n=1 Tax=Penicillium angulare TaxID=116970 RepID=UPI00254254B4|nr:uncharacterized protein N7478_007093 [Penicillium angulare]KAJ5281721.1 hypothetical protein N7478_007093 [Penicillium angulare]